MQKITNGIFADSTAVRNGGLKTDQGKIAANGLTEWKSSVNGVELPKKYSRGRSGGESFGFAIESAKRDGSQRMSQDKITTNGRADQTSTSVSEDCSGQSHGTEFGGSSTSL